MSFSPVEITEGVRFTSVDTSRGKSDSLSVSFIIPLNEKNLASVALISKILSRGTAGFPDTGRICRECEDNYSASFDIFYQKSGDRIVLTFLTSFLRSRYAFGDEDIASRAISFLREFIFTPLLIDGTFDPRYTEREKITLLQQIASIINNKPRYALKRAADIMCENEPFAISVYNCAAIVKELTPKELADFFAYVVSDTPVEIIYAGETERNEAVKLISSALPFGPRKPFSPIVFRTRGVEKVRRVTEEAASSQSTLVMGFRINSRFDENTFGDAALFGALLSLSPVSKLFMNVREKLSLCYYCNSSLNRFDGVMTVYAGIDAKNSAKTQKAILKQIEEIKNGVITDEEMSNAIKSNYSAYISFTDDTSSLCSFYLSRLLYGIYRTPEEECASSLASVRKDAVRIAQTIKLDTVYLLKGSPDA